MKKLLLAMALTSMFASTAALAHGHDHDRGHGRDRHEQSWHRDQARYDHHHDNGRHLGQYRHWGRGERLPDVYRHSNYYVTNYRTYRLAPPPRGYVWVRPYPDAREYYLVQAATGLISQIFGF